MSGVSNVYFKSESEFVMLMKLLGGLAVAAGLFVAGIAGTSSSSNDPSAANAGTCCAKGAECCSEDCCDGCPDCKCECDCCANCDDGCECPNKP